MGFLLGWGSVGIENRGSGDGDWDVAFACQRREAIVQELDEGDNVGVVATFGLAGHEVQPDSTPVLAAGDGSLTAVPLLVDSQYGQLPRDERDGGNVIDHDDIRAAIVDVQRARGTRYYLAAVDRLVAAAGLLAVPAASAATGSAVTISVEQADVIEAASRHRTRMIPTVAHECSESMQTCTHEDECPTVGEAPVCGGCYDVRLERDGEVFDDSGIRPEDCPICVAVDRLAAGEETT